MSRPGELWKRELVELALDVAPRVARVVAREGIRTVGSRKVARHAAQAKRIGVFVDMLIDKVNEIANEGDR